MNTTQAERIARARRGIILDAPFFGSLIMRLKMIESDEIPTFATDGKSILYNVGFCTSLTDTQIRGVLVHEVAHVALSHLWRKGQRNMKQWNHATDYAINEMITSYSKEIVAAGKPAPWDLPPRVLLNPTFFGKSSEEIYHLLQSSGNSCDEPGPGDFMEPGETKAQESYSETEWKIAVTQAANAAKMMGDCPGVVRRLVDGLLNPKVPWQELFREFFTSLSRDDYAWSRPARRYLHQGVVLPGLYSERVGMIVAAVDTSGSITPYLLQSFTTELQAILDQCKPEKLVVIYCDAAINKVSEYLPGDAIALDEAVGGGGTDFRPVWDCIDQMDDQPVAAVYLTDLYGRHRKEEPAFPVLWATYGTDDAPWGTVVRVE